MQLPAGTRLLDLSSATVLPGMIDTHVHVSTGGNTPGFTTVLDMDSRGSFYMVDLRDAINSGIVQGPRMQVVGQAINQRATNYYPDSQSVRYWVQSPADLEIARMNQTTSWLRFLTTISATTAALVVVALLPQGGHYARVDGGAPVYALSLVKMVVPENRLTAPLRNLWRLPCGF